MTVDEENPAPVEAPSAEDPPAQAAQPTPPNLDSTEVSQATPTTTATGTATRTSMAKSFMSALKHPVLKSLSQDAQERSSGRSSNGNNSENQSMDNSSKRNKKNPKVNDYVQQKKQSNRNSLELRKLPVDILLAPEEENDSLGGSTLDGEGMEQNGSSKGGGRHGVGDSAASFLQKTCLNSNFSLRTQMMLSFGIVSSFTIILVVAVGLVASVLTGDSISEMSADTFNELAKNVAGTTAHYLSDDLKPRILPADLVQLVYEATRDRFAGYPTFENDSSVPFFDINSQTNVYPLEGPPLPLDWQFEAEWGGNVNETNYEEHVQDRYAWYSHSPRLETSSAAFYMQGMCDPSADPESSLYYPNCTDANNDVTTGGVVAPSPTTAQIHRKASDLNPLLKALYEYHQDVKNIGVYFSNSGAGATAIFPHYEMNSTNTYTSGGCNWMLADHPLDPKRTFASLEEFERCELGGVHVNGKTISSRIYNPLDREWCQKQALHPEKVHHAGPIESAWQKGRWFMTLGRAVYDRITNDFVACIAVDFVLDSVEAKLRASKVTEGSEVSVVRFGESGTVVASTAWNSTFATQLLPIDELNIGLNNETYSELYNLVSYTSDWDPKEVESLYEDTLIYGDGYLVACYPMPPIPQQYDRNYRPEFLVVVSVAEDEFFRRTNTIQANVENTVDGIGRIILFVGLAGLLLMVTILYMVSNALTSPLTYMNTIAADIIHHFGGVADDEAAIEVNQNILKNRFVPKTELDDIVTQFMKLIKNFSGSNMAKNAKEMTKDIANHFSLVDEFSELYESRSADKKFKYNFPTNTPTIQQKIERKGAPSYRVNFGRSIPRHSLGGTSVTTRDAEDGQDRMTSPLFFWIVVLIVTPLLLTQLSISCTLLVSIANSFPSYLGQIKEKFVEQERFALDTYVHLRAGLTAITTERAMRDNHVLLRYSTWILFGALNRTNSFTEMTSATEECKVYANFSDCPYMQTQVCDCAWNDRRGEGGKCFDYNTTDSRYLQQVYYVTESNDNEADGDRLLSSYPRVSYSQETTAWWDDVTTVPGAEEVYNSTRYESTYDRYGSASALPIFPLLYNYDIFRETTILGADIAFEDDGSFIGYSGCSASASYSKWVSSVENGAYGLRPEICPLGKYGYDPRCRNWYHRGKESGGVNGSFIYVTPPYLFVGAKINAQSASSPLIDPRTGKHVGQTLIDFVSQPILDSLNKDNFALSEKGFPVLITIETDNFQADTVIGPGLEGEAKPVEQLVLPYEPGCIGAACDEGFFGILQAMKAGKNGTENFTRVASDGSRERIHFAYAPVYVKVFEPVNSSDFSRGVALKKYLLYSLAFAEFEDAMLEEFTELENEIQTLFYIVLSILCLTIVLSTLFVVFFSNIITVSMTTPMLHLLQLMKTINSLKDGEDRPEPPKDRRYGSREVLHVTYTMERLYTVIRSANTAYFCGDVETAYEVLKNALKLFTRLGNPKAIGVACNNLGNTMLAAYRTLKTTKEKKICGFKKKEIIAKGTGYFHEAIQQGEKAYDEFYEREGWSPNCLDFMQHLSNRYFNRAMFLLSVKDDHAKPEEIQELGMRDLQISRDMDVEIVDEGGQVGWNVRGLDKRFDVMLSRFRGHLSLLEMGYPDDFDLEEWMGEAVQLLRKEMKTPDESSLFSEMKPTGRQQQIETELMKYYSIIGDITTAAKIAIRMLVEDEYVLPNAELMSVIILEKYVNEEGAGIKSDVKEALVIFRERIEYLVDDASMDHQRERADSLSDSISLATSEFLGRSSVQSETGKQRRRSTLMQSSRGDITMEMF